MHVIFLLFFSFAAAGWIQASNLRAELDVLHLAPPRLPPKELWCNSLLEALISRSRRKKIKQYTDDFSSPRVQWSLPPRRRIRARGGLRILEAKRPVLSRTEEDAAASTSFFQRRRRRRRRPTRRDRRHCGRKTESKKKHKYFTLKKRVPRH